MTPSLAAAPSPPGSAASAQSLVDLLCARCLDACDRPAVVDSLGGEQPFSWAELITSALAAADRLEAAGLRRGDRLAHLGPHAIEWIVVDLACLLTGVVHVALHADDPRGEVCSQLDWLRPRGILFSGGHPAWRRGLPPDMKVVEPPCRDPRIAPLAPDSLRSAVGRHAAACDPDAPATIFLSSGTTGRPHGVVHSQRTLAANAVAASAVFLDEPSDVRLSWLPLSHALARTGDLYTTMVRGGCLNLVTQRHRAFEACRALAPTVILGVPAFFERLERGVAAGRIAELSAALGGRVRVCVSGGAPLRRRTAEAFAARGVPLVQGYGLAEAGPVVTLANPRNARPGTVGPPLAGVRVRIDARPESRGQLLVQTPSRALEILRPDEASSQSAQSSGAPPDPDWIETGDLAEIEPDGQVRITGRVVDSLVLASGVKLPPAAVERALAEDPAVAQVCVIGAALPWPVAVIVPEPDVLRAAIKKMGLRFRSRAQALSDGRVLSWLARRLATRQRGLPRAWRVRRAVLVGRPFDTAHGETTSSLKLKRGVIADHFRWVVDAAAADQPPRWMAVVPVGQASGTTRNGRNLPSAAAPLAGALWRRAGGGFAEAASWAAVPQRDAVAAVLEQTDHAIDHLRADRMLYEPLPMPAAWSRPPLADAPAAPQGVFSRQAEEALGETGLWGLAVPEAFGGSGCTMQELVAAITHLAERVPTAAGMLSVHSSIGAVAALAAFGSPAQQSRHLPGLALGRPLSIFGATEPGAGCDLSAIRTVLERREGRLLLTGTKMFITGATHGRLVKLLALLDGRPTVALVRLPDSDTPTFRLRHYALHPLKHAHNAALEFTGFEVDAADLLAAPLAGHAAPDGMPIVWHGLNRGRITLAAQAAGTLRILLAQAREHAQRRRTWGEPIGSRQLVQGRLARIAARIIACDSLAAWAAGSIDTGGSGELEAITAKIVAGECVRESAIDALGVHGGRAFLVGHPLGDSFHDHLAVTVYEGESDLLGLALFKGLAKHHPLATLARDPSATRRAAGWLAWRAGCIASSGSREDTTILDAELRGHARRARRALATLAIRVDRAIRVHGRALAERQLEVGALSTEVRDLTSVLAVAHHADATGDDTLFLSADCWCRLAFARAGDRRLTAADHAQLGELGRAIATG